MKSFTKISFILAFSFLSLNISSAQMGMRIGLNVSNAALSDVGQNIETSNVGGLDIGFLYELNIAYRLSLQGEIHYNQSGYKLDQINTQVNLYNIEIPLLVKYSITSGDMRPFLVAGPYASYAVSGRTISPTGDRIDINFNEDFNHWDYGLKIGAGVDINHFFFDIRYSHGLANLSKSPTGIDRSYNSRSLQFGAGYNF